MKKYLSALLALLVLLGSASALAAQDAPPAHDGASLMAEGKARALVPQFMGVSENLLCFAYEAVGGIQSVTLWLPVDAQPGDIINPLWAQRAQRADCQVMYGEKGAEPMAAFISKTDYTAMPRGASFTIILDDISADGRTYTGRFDAVVKDYLDETIWRDLQAGQFRMTLDDETFAAVRAWQDAQGTGTPAASPALAPEATFAPEPAATLVLPDDGYGEWQAYSDNTLHFHLEVQNISRRDTVAGFELYFYTVDRDGNRMGAEDEFITQITEVTLAPGERMVTEDVILPDMESIGEVYCLVNSVLYADDTFVTNPDREYSFWNIPPLEEE